MPDDMVQANASQTLAGEGTRKDFDCFDTQWQPRASSLQCILDIRFAAEGQAQWACGQDPVLATSQGEGCYWLKSMVTVMKAEILGCDM